MNKKAYSKFPIVEVRVRGLLAVQGLPFSYYDILEGGLRNSYVQFYGPDRGLLGKLRILNREGWGHHLLNTAWYNYINYGQERGI